MGYTVDDLAKDVLDVEGIKVEIIDTKTGRRIRSDKHVQKYPFVRGVREEWNIGKFCDYRLRKYYPENFDFNIIHNEKNCHKNVKVRTVRYC